MRKKKYLLLLLIFPFGLLQAQTKIIDMHIQSYLEDRFATPVRDGSGNPGSANAVAHRKETFAAFAKLNIVKAMVSGSPESVEVWKKYDTNNHIIRGIAMDAPNEFGMTPPKLEQMIKEKKIEVFGGLGPYYTGGNLSDSAWEPYLAICEKYDIPVAVHTGGGPPEQHIHGRLNQELISPILF